MSGDIPSLTPVAAPAQTGGIGVDSSRLGSRANLEKAGRQFESVFTAMMLKSMRQAHLGSDLFESQGLDTFRDMQDQKVSQAMADHAPLGIGKALVAFLAKAQTANEAAASAAPAPDSGRTAR